MSKKQKKPRSKSIKKNRDSVRSKPFPWLRWLKKSLIASAFMLVIGGAFAVYSQSEAKKYDLSVIGNGKATVVQIHDPNCQLCRRLKNNLDAVKTTYKEDIQFKIANIKTSKGQAFASKHRVSHVTLLFFNKRGQRVDTIQGVTPKKIIKEALQKLANQ